MRAKITLVAAGFVLVLATTSLAGTVLYGTTGAILKTGGGTTSTLITIDPTSGAVLSTIGPIGYTVNGLEYDATTGKLFATTGTLDPNFALGLIEINLATGAGTPIGTGFGAIGRVTNLTSDSSGQLWGWTENGDDLVRVDKSTGLATVVGDAGVQTGRHTLAVNGSDVMYLVDPDNQGNIVYTVDPSTGLPTAVGALGVVIHHGDFNPDNGLLYGPGDAIIDTSVVHLRVANLSTFTTVDLPQTIRNLHTVSFGAAGAPNNLGAVPLPAAAWAGLGMLGLLGLARRIRRRS